MAQALLPNEWELEDEQLSTEKLSSRRVFSFIALFHEN